MEKVRQLMIKEELWEPKKRRAKKTIGLKEKEKTISEKCNSLTAVMTADLRQR